MATKRTIPKTRRQYHSVYGLIGGLNYSVPTTMLAETETPNCREVTFRDQVIEKAYGNTYFASTDECPLLTTVMAIRQYVKNNETSFKLMVHTMENVYAYNSTSELMECVTEGEVVEDCEDAWSANANVSCDVDVDARKGTNSVEITIAEAFTTGVAAYENFDVADLSGYDHLHFYIKSSVATLATDLGIRISEENAGGTGGGYEDISIPALEADTWTEVSVAFVEAAATRNATLSVSLVVAANQPAIVINLDDVMATIETTGDEDNNVVGITINDYYVFSNGIIPLKYWDMSDDTVVELTGGESLACRAMALLGERLCIYWASGAPKRVQWTVAGGISVPAPLATDWTESGSGDADLDSVFGDDVIQTAHRLGNYVVIYGKKTIAMQEYTGVVDAPFSFYTRVPGEGTPSERGVVNLGNSHIVMGWDDIYIFEGGTTVTSIGDKVSAEIFRLVNPEFIQRSFLVYLNEQHEVRLYFPLIGSELPNCYFTYSLKNGSWSRGNREYTTAGEYTKKSADIWDVPVAGTWDEEVGRWDDSKQEVAAPINLYGDKDGVIYEDAETEYNLAGTAIDGYFETKDFVVGTGYRRATTNWMELHFEALGHTLNVSYSSDLGRTWSNPITFTLTTEWEMYRYDLNVNSPQVRFKFRNNQSGETFSLRQLELGYVEASDRGV